MRIYRLITSQDWLDAQKVGKLTATDADKASGFMHFSPASEVAETARRYFETDPPPLVLELDSVDFGQALKMERVSSRNNVAFPHYFGSTVPVSHVKAVWELKTHLAKNLKP